MRESEHGAGVADGVSGIRQVREIRPHLRTGAGGAQPLEYDLHDFDVHLRLAWFLPEHVLVASLGLVGRVRILPGNFGRRADRGLASGKAGTLKPFNDCALCPKMTESIVAANV